MERCNMFKCAMAFLWSLFIAFFYFALSDIMRV